MAASTDMIEKLSVAPTNMVEPEPSKKKNAWGVKTETIEGEDA
jgi:hypothetical protein